MNTTDRVEDLSNAIKKYLTHSPIADFGLDTTELAEYITNYQQSTTPTIQLEEGEFDEDELIRLADEWVFITNGNKWSNNNNEAGDNYGSFKAGYKAAYQQRSSERVFSLKDIEDAFEAGIKFTKNGSYTLSKEGATILSFNPTKEQFIENLLNKK